MDTRYVALLRGINVGGHRVKMERLRQVFAELGLSNVRSYINSGNVFFEAAARDRAALTETIERALQSALGYEVPTFLRTLPELQAIIDRDPFKAFELTDDQRFSVVFSAEPLSQELTLPISTPKDDMEMVGLSDFEAFVIWHLRAGRPPSSKFPVDVLPVRNTTRFFHTLKKILAAGS